MWKDGYYLDQYLKDFLVFIKYSWPDFFSRVSLLHKVRGCHTTPEIKGPLALNYEAGGLLEKDPQWNLCVLCICHQSQNSNLWFKIHLLLGSTHVSTQLCKKYFGIFLAITTMLWFLVWTFYNTFQLWKWFVISFCVRY